MEALDLAAPDLSEICRAHRFKEDFFRWPALPTGIFENIRMSDSHLQESEQKAKDTRALWDQHPNEFGPRYGALELKYRYPERYVK